MTQTWRPFPILLNEPQKHNESREKPPKSSRLKLTQSFQQLTSLNVTLTGAPCGSTGKLAWLSEMLGVADNGSVGFLKICSNCVFSSANGTESVCGLKKHEFS